MFYVAYALVRDARSLNGGYGREAVRWAKVLRVIPAVSVRQSPRVSWA